MRLPLLTLLFMTLGCGSVPGESDSTVAPSQRAAYELDGFRSAYNEPPLVLGPSLIEGYRLLIEPAFLPPRIVRAEHRSYGYFVAVRLMAADNGPGRFQVASEYLARVSEGRFRAFVAEVDRGMPCTLPQKTSYGIDGESYYIEIVRPGLSCVVSRWSPDPQRSDDDAHFMFARNAFEYLLVPE